MATKKTTSKMRPDNQGKNTEVGYKKPPKDTRWKTGQSGNPAGRPKSRTLSEELRARLQEQYPGKPAATYGRMVAHKLIDLAIDGEIGAIKEVYDRVEGKPRQAIDISVEDKKREMVENALAALMADTGIERDEAIERLAAVAPQVSELIR
jgi:hypothetical protein